ncbi:MAG TPA: hypothetical protein VGH08_08505 [Chthoniobacterales bacterium]|jgi:hypothetical protein
MRYVIIVGLAALGIIFYRQKSTERSPGQVASAEHASSLQPTTLTPRPASEHNWAKSAIDRAQDVKKQVKRERASNEVP